MGFFLNREDNFFLHDAFLTLHLTCLFFFLYVRNSRKAFARSLYVKVLFIPFLLFGNHELATGGQKMFTRP